MGKGKAEGGPARDRTGGLTSDRWFEALDWHTALQNPESEQLTRDEIHRWHEWISEDRNRLVFDQISLLLDDQARYRRRSLPNATDVATDTYDPSIPLTEWLRMGAGHAAHSTPAMVRVSSVGIVRGRRRPALVAIAATVMVAIVTGIVSLAPPTSERISRREALEAPAQVAETGPAEVRSLRLEDGSAVTLGADSSITVQFTLSRRSVRLGRGEALFRVAHNVDRPFVVTAGARTITAVGTAFVVKRDSDRVVVTVTDGSVEVAPSAAAVEQPATNVRVSRLSAARIVRGEQMSYADAGNASAIGPADLRAAIAWSEGRLQFDHEPLRYVVQAVNRYSPRKIQLDQPSGELLYTGLVFQDEIDAWIRGLENIFPVIVVRKGERVCVRSRQTPATRSNPCDIPR